MLNDDQVFVLFEDARPGGGPARLFTSPSETIVARSLAEVGPALEAVRAGLRRGRYAAGWMSYEAGLAFEPRLMRQAPAATGGPLLWFGLFDAAAEIAPEALALALPDAAGAWLSPPRPRLSRPAYDAAFARVRDYIVAGDVYQINLSYRADVDVLGHPLAAYARLRAAGRGGWSAVAHDGASWLLSTSPELFFKLRAGAIEARPMKGTAKRGADAAADRAAAQALREDAKERAENVMIVDLLRNDISRIARRGSVHVPELFAVETYPTLHTLTSTVRADLREGCDAVDALLALFPCGSITGAPKIRAMEIIQELETDRRGVYTGSIGWIGPDGSAEFNVAIRTLALRDGRGELGLGSAVVYDSTVDGEWEECRTKGAFVSAGAPAFSLIETMRCAPGEAVPLLDLHMARLGASAATFGFVFDGAAVRARVAEAAAMADAACVLRLLLSSDGAVSIERKPLPAFAGGEAQVRLAPLPVRSDDFRLRHKTTLREFYDAARAGADEVVFVDEAGFVTEGSVSSVFVERNGVLLTPPATRGLLPGVLRAALLADGRAREAELRPGDLDGGFFVGNAVRGLTPARLAAAARKRA